MKFFATIFLIALLLQVFAEASLLNNAAKSLASMDEENAVALVKYHHHHRHHKPINCRHECGRRCSKASRKKRCLRACNTCCNRCHCVPPGTYGNKNTCPCYANLKTHGNRPKCP